jgi:hypothetical protein
MADKFIYFSPIKMSNHKQPGSGTLQEIHRARYSNSDYKYVQKLLETLKQKNIGLVVNLLPSLELFNTEDFMFYL